MSPDPAETHPEVDTGLRPESEWPSDWLRATLGIFVLRALEPEPSYGYAIITELEKAGLGLIKGGTLYPLLSRFERSGLVRTQWRPGQGGPGRKYFELTDEGRSELHRQSTLWIDFTDHANHYLEAAQREEKTND